jgi:REP-associated tyrosine transposase
MTKTNIQHGRTCVFNCNYHIVFSTKYRRKVLTEEVVEYLQDTIREVAADKGFRISLCEVGERDHVHLFASAHPKVAPSYIVKMTKGISARKIFIRFPGIKKMLHKGHLWNSSFYVETIGSISEEAVKQYIEKQKGPHDSD